MAGVTTPRCALPPPRPTPHYEKNPRCDLEQSKKNIAQQGRILPVSEGGIGAAACPITKGRPLPLSSPHCGRKSEKSRRRIARKHKTGYGHRSFRLR